MMFSNVQQFQTLFATTPQLTKKGNAFVYQFKRGEELYAFTLSSTEKMINIRVEKDTHTIGLFEFQHIHHVDIVENRANEKRLQLVVQHEQKIQVVDIQLKPYFSIALKETDSMTVGVSL